MTTPPPKPTGSVQDALRVMRERFRAASASTINAFEALSRQLASAPDAPELVEALRRELHRVHGTAGTFGFMDASRLAAELEQRAIRWARDPLLEREHRAPMVLHFASALRLALDDTAEAADLRGMALVGFPPEDFAALSAEGVLRGFRVTALAPAECTRERLREVGPHVAATPASQARAVAGAFAAAGVPLVAVEDRPLAERGGEDAWPGTVALVEETGDEDDAVFAAAERLLASTSLSGATVLVVDDDPSILAIVRLTVERQGMRVVTLHEPARLREVLADSRPSLLLMDIQMGGWDGLELTRELRGQPAHRDLPIVVFSSATDPAQRQRAMDAGADGFVAKPIVPDELVARLEAELERRRLQRLARGEHPATALPLADRAAREAAAHLSAVREAGEPFAVAVVRPVGALDPARAAAWVEEVRRLAARVAPGFAGYHDEVSLLLARSERDGPLDERLLEAAVDRPEGAPAWHAGIADADSVSGSDLAALRRAAVDALERAEAGGEAVLRWAAGEGGAAPDVVLVEDDASLAQMVQFALRSSGFTFRHYANGVEALDALLAMRPGARRPLLLLDVDLPGMDGHSLHERLRLERPGAFAVVFLSARAAESEQIRALRGGAIDYVPKPLSLRVLMAKVPVWIALTNRGREG